MTSALFAFMEVCNDTRKTMVRSKKYPESTTGCTGATGTARMYQDGNLQRLSISRSRLHMLGTG